MIGVVIVTYNSSDVITDCLESLNRSDHPSLKIVICDNASSDDSIEQIRDWASRRGVELAEHKLAAGAGLALDDLPAVTLIHSGRNLGFAGGVNIGLAALLPHEEVDLFWILNPDSIALPGTAVALARCAQANPGFGLLGGRIVYEAPPNLIQSDGGRVSPWTGICRNINQGRTQGEATPPRSATLDFISGAHLVASRQFVEQVGPMREDYFLYYEEVEWAARRGDLPLVLCADAVIRHHGGSSIGTGSVTRRASPFANYFNYRNRIRFMRQFHRVAVPVAYFASLLRVLKLFLSGGGNEAAAALRGLFGLAPPESVAARISPDAADLAFGPRASHR